MRATRSSANSRGGGTRTAGGAWAAHMEGLTGTLRPGMAADIVLLSGDIEATRPKDVAGLGIAMTIAGGRVTHHG